MEKQKVNVKDKKVLTLFLALAPSVLLAMTSMVSSTWLRIAFQIFLLLIQFVIVKNILDDYYAHF